MSSRPLSSALWIAFVLLVACSSDQGEEVPDEYGVGSAPCDDARTWTAPDGTTMVTVRIDGVPGKGIRRVCL